MQQTQSTPRPLYCGICLALLQNQLVFSLILGLFGFLLNLIPIPITRGVYLFLGPVVATIPAVAYGLRYGMLSGLVALLALLFRSNWALAAAFHLVNTIVVSLLSRNHRTRIFTVELVGLFWLGLGVWILDQLIVFSPNLIGPARTTVLLSHVLSALLGTSAACWIILLLPTTVWERTVPISSYINRMHGIILIGVIALVTSLGTGRIVDVLNRLYEQRLESYAEIILASLQQEADRPTRPDPDSFDLQTESTLTAEKHYSTVSVYLIPGSYPITQLFPNHRPEDPQRPGAVHYLSPRHFSDPIQKWRHSVAYMEAQLEKYPGSRVVISSKLLGTADFIYDVLSYWLGGLLILALLSLAVTPCVALPLSRSVYRLIKASAVRANTLDALEDLNQYRTRVLELDMLRQHMHMVLTSLRDTIHSLEIARWRIAEQNERLVEQSLQMEFSAKRDYLTGLLNSRSLESHMAMIWPLIQAGDLEISVLAIDVDHFKQYNDSHGHLAGNELLTELARIMLLNVRTDDIVARYGGEEFIAIIHNTNAEQGIALGERIRKAVEKSGLGVTVSIGVAQSQTTDPHWEALFNRADMALYRAKETGRNRVVFQSQLEENK